MGGRAQLSFAWGLVPLLCSPGGLGTLSIENGVHTHAHTHALPLSFLLCVSQAISIGLQAEFFLFVLGLEFHIWVHPLTGPLGRVQHCCLVPGFSSSPTPWASP